MVTYVRSKLFRAGKDSDVLGIGDFNLTDGDKSAIVRINLFELRDALSILDSLEFDSVFLQLVECKTLDGDESGLLIFKEKYESPNGLIATGMRKEEV